MLNSIDGTPEIVFAIEGRHYTITLKRHAFPRGGRWYTFRCPLCSSGRFKLYFLKSILGCHKCHKLAYWSENRGKADRAVNMKWKYVYQIAKEANDAPRKPPGMHQQTYDHIMNKVARYDQLAWAHFYG